MAGSHETKDRSKYMFRVCTECVGIRMYLLNLPVSLLPPNRSYSYDMTSLHDQPDAQRSCTMHFQSFESGVSPDGVVTERDVRTTNECNLEGECGHINSNLEGLWYNHAKPNVVQYQLPDDDLVYEMKATGYEGTECDGPTRTVPYAWRKTRVSFKSPNGWGKSTLVPDGSKMDQSGLKRDKTVYFEDDHTLVGSANVDEQQEEAL